MPNGDNSHAGHTRVLSEAGNLKSLDEEWASVTKAQKLAGVGLTEDPEVCSLCREGTNAKKKVFACRVCKIGLCTVCVPKQETCSSCTVFIQGPHVVYKEGVLSTELLGKLFSTSYVRFIGDAVFAFAVQPDPLPPIGVYDLWTAVSLHVSKYVFVMNAAAEREEQAGAECSEPGTMFCCALQTGKDKKYHHFIADSASAASMWMSAISRVVESSHTQIKTGVKQDFKDEIAVEGQLKILTGFPKSWKSFYFQLQKAGRLVYYKEDPNSPTKCLRMLSLRGSTCKSNTQRIIIVNGPNSACFRPLPADYDSWLLAIALAVEKAQQASMKKGEMSHDQLFGLQRMEPTEQGVFAIGDIVITFGLTSTTHNGLRGKVVTGPDNGRFEIMLPSGEIVRFKAVNLKYPDEDELIGVRSLSPRGGGGGGAGNSTTSLTPITSTSSSFSTSSSPPADSSAFENKSATTDTNKGIDPLDTPSSRSAPTPTNAFSSSSTTTTTTATATPATTATATATATTTTTTTVPTTPSHSSTAPPLTPTSPANGRFITTPSVPLTPSSPAAAGRLLAGSSPEADEFLKQLGRYGGGGEVKPLPVAADVLDHSIDPEKLLAELSSRPPSMQETVESYQAEFIPQIKKLETRNAELEKEIAALRIVLASVPDTQRQINELRAVVVGLTASSAISSFLPALPSTPLLLPPGSPSHFAPSSFHPSPMMFAGAGGSMIPGLMLPPTLPPPQRLLHAAGGQMPISPPSMPPPGFSFPPPSQPPPGSPPVVMFPRPTSPPPLSLAPSPSSATAEPPPPSFGVVLP